MLKKLLALSAAALLTVASYVVAQELREDHPDTYVVQRGDTLWDIAGRFLRQPWLWPEIWQANPQIENPHLIYPGDVISLAYLGGRPTLQVVKRSPEVRRSDIDPVPAVPLSDVEAFLKRLHVLDEDELEGLPYVLALEENRLRGASGQIAYVRGLEGEPGSRWAFVRPHVRYVMHPHPTTDERRLRSDPWSAAHGVEPHQSGRMWAYYAASDNGFEVLGYELIEVGSGTVTRDGETSTLLIADDGREVKAGDLLLPVDDQPFDLMFHPRAPDRVPADMRVLAVTDGVAYSGPRHVVALSAGSRQGVANGQVYAIYNPGDLVRDEIAHPVRMSANRKKNKVQLPDEFGGHVMIFRTFDKVSYGLVMDGIRPIRVGDVAKRPVDL